VMNDGLFVAGVPLLALYRVLREEYAMSEPAAIALLDEAAQKSMSALFQSRVRRAGLRLQFEQPLVRNLGMRVAYAADEAHGFKFKKVDMPAGEFAFDVTECGLVKYMRAEGAPEIMPIICRLDDVMADQLHQLRLVRTGTIGTGAERCDFRYVRKA
jgi:hypothetical protein